MDHKVERLSMPLIYGHEFDAKEVEALEDKEAISGVTGQTVERFGQDDIELVSLCCGE
jgi:hypothetical protein